MKGVQVTTAARLHLGFLDLNGDLGRRFGSIGLAIDAFETRVELREAPSFEVLGEERERGARYCAPHRRMSRPRYRERSSSSRTPFPRMPGSAPALSSRWRSRRRFVGWPACRSTREAMRACSIAARVRAWGSPLFERGGLAVDAGRGPNTEIPPVVAWVNFPRDWRVLLILDPRVEGAHGEAERRAFAGLPRFPADVGERNLPPHAHANPARRRRRGFRGFRRRRRQDSGNPWRPFRPCPGRRPLHQRSR